MKANQDHESKPTSPSSAPVESTDRRGFFGKVALIGSLTASYGLFAGFAVRFIFPGERRRKKTKLFVGYVADLPHAGSYYFTTPSGEEFVLTQSDSPTQPYHAYSSKCPHLGCRVRWEHDAKRFYCPCHGGMFDASGKAIGGPPKKAGQSLKSVEVDREGGSIYAYVEIA